MFGQSRECLEHRSNALLAILGAPDEEQVGLFGLLGNRMKDVGVGSVVDDRHVLLGDFEIFLDCTTRGFGDRHDF